MASKGLSLVPKLKLEHIELTAFSRMRVDLAAQGSLCALSLTHLHTHTYTHIPYWIHLQVLSKSVGDALAYFGDEETAETEKFVQMFDRFFDCMNVRSLTEWKSKLKPDLKPYTSADDRRLMWLEDTFLSYLTAWKEYVNGCEEIPDDCKQKALLSSMVWGSLFAHLLK